MLRQEKTFCILGAWIPDFAGDGGDRIDARVPKHPVERALAPCPTGRGCKANRAAGPSLNFVPCPFYDVSPLGKGQIAAFSGYGREVYAMLRSRADDSPIIGPADHHVDNVEGH